MYVSPAGIILKEMENEAIDVVSRHVLKDYALEGLSKDDVVIDLGAHGGAFSLHAALLAKLVYAVEPIRCEWLKQNIALNHATNIIVLEEAIGDGSTMEVGWGEVVKTMKTKTLSEILQNLDPPPTYLKSDIEGYEWYILPSELEDIPRLELELHDKRPVNFDLIRWLIDQYYCMWVPHRAQGVIAIVHCFKKDTFTITETVFRIDQ